MTPSEAVDDVLVPPSLANDGWLLGCAPGVPGLPGSHVTYAMKPRRGGARPDVPHDWRLGFFRVHLRTHSAIESFDRLVYAHEGLQQPLPDRQRRVARKGWWRRVIDAVRRLIDRSRTS